MLVTVLYELETGGNAFVIDYRAETGVLDHGMDDEDHRPIAETSEESSRGDGFKKRVPFKVVKDGFPFEVEDFKFFALRQLGRTRRYCWLFVHEDQERIPVINDVLIFKVLPQIGTENPTISIASGDHWWTTFVEMGRSSSLDETDNPSRKRMSDASTRALVSREFDLGASTAAAAVAVQKGWEQSQKMASKFASWAKKGIAKATDAMAMSETVELTSSTVMVKGKLAEGGFSTVFLAKSLDGDRAFALKRCLANSKEDLNALQMEIEVHRAVDSPFVLKLFDYAIADSKRVQGAREVSLLLPLLQAGSAYDCMQTEHANRVWPYPENVAAYIGVGLCKGLMALHDARFAHRDVKPHNLMFQTESAINPDQYQTFLPHSHHLIRPILMDLGSCAKIPVRIGSRREALMAQDEATVKCSAPYRAPELYDVQNGAILDEAMDVWSVGCVLYALTYGRSYSPFEDPIQGVKTLAILQGNASFPVSNRANGYTYSENWTRIIKAALSPDPSKRPSLEEVLSKLERAASLASS